MSATPRVVTPSHRTADRMLSLDDSQQRAGEPRSELSHPSRDETETVLAGRLIVEFNLVARVQVAVAIHLDHAEVDESVAAFGQFGR